jgi:plastocyanin
MSAKPHLLAVVGGLAVVVALVAAGCGSSGSSASEEPTAMPSMAMPSESAATSEGSPAAANAVTIANFAYDPATITVPVGTTITWTNTDSVDHTVTADDRSWDSGHIAQGQTFSRTFTTAGTFPYFCTIHPNMKGTVIVTP